MIWTSIFTLLALPFAFAAEGDTCAYNGLNGVCVDVGKCAYGFSISGYCPHDPANVKCCISKSCTSPGGQAGTCLNNAPGKCAGGSFFGGRCPGPSDVQCCVPAEDVTVDFWINSFIPLHIDGLTKPYPKDTSKTMIPGPLSGVGIGDCFLTDERDFDSNILAKARVHSQATVIFKSNFYDYTQQNYCGETTKVDCASGEGTGTKTATNEGMGFTLVDGSTNKVVLKFAAAGGNPFFTLAPKIDLNGMLTVDRVNKFVEFVGMVDAFPAFEAWVSINGGAPRNIAKIGPTPGTDPWNLIGDANRPFQGRVSF